MNKIKEGIPNVQRKIEGAMDEPKAAPPARPKRPPYPLRIRKLKSGSLLIDHGAEAVEETADEFLVRRLALGG